MVLVAVVEHLPMPSQVRCIKKEDLDQLREIHSKYYADQFNFPDFFDYLCAFVIEDEHGIVTAGGVRDIPEVIALTDKTRDPKDRVDALYQLLDASIYTARKLDYEQLYVFSQDPRYANRIRRSGFRPHRGQALIIDL